MVGIWFALTFTSAAAARHPVAGDACTCTCTGCVPFSGRGGSNYGNSKTCGAEKGSMARLSLMCSCTDIDICSMHALHELYRSACTTQILPHNTWVTSATSVIFYLGSINCTYLDRHNFLIICGSYSEKMKEENY